MSEAAKNLFDNEDLDAKTRAIAEARAQLDSGQGVSNDAVKAWLKDLAAGRRRPPPCG